MVSINELDNKYRHVIEKVRNPKLGDRVAWETAQPLLAHIIRGYPKEFMDSMDFIRNVFVHRREAYLNHDRERNLKKAKELSSGLDDAGQDRFEDILVSIRDLFDIPAPSGRK